jgi:hypothetical protein
MFTKAAQFEKFATTTACVCVCMLEGKILKKMRQKSRREIGGVD